MYGLETSRSQGVNTIDSATTGRILVVDDDRAFGGFMQAALETRGHQVEWATCVADGLSSLYAGRYELVIVDLRLPDGSGFELLRDAADEGLLHDTSAIILTGHDFDEPPSDIRVFQKPLDLDPFLDRMADIIAQTKRRRAQGATRPSANHRAVSHDSSRPGKGVKIELVLYTSAASEKCQKAIRTVSSVLERYNTAQVRFSICDLSGRPQSAEEDSVVFTPTLVKRGPGPRTWIVGNLDQPDLLVDLLEVSGVERRNDR
jgi:CheY-like chemotaxis protein